MTAVNLKVGQILRGTLNSYAISKPLQDCIWTATTSTGSPVIVKTAPGSRLRREADILHRFRSHASIRQLIECIDDPPCLVLEHLKRDALEASETTTLPKRDTKFIAKRILEALKSLHAEGVAHTDVKPNNVLLGFDPDSGHVIEAKLADCGDAWEVGANIDPTGTGHDIGAIIFRSPEAMMNLRWSTATDVWSFGATLCSLLWGRNYHLFKPPGIPFEDENYDLRVAIEHARYFEPFPEAYKDWVSDDEWVTMKGIGEHLDTQGALGERKPFYLLEDKELTTEDKTFICKIMRMDPRERPTAAELLEDAWFTATLDDPQDKIQDCTETENKNHEEVTAKDVVA